MDNTIQDQLKKAAELCNKGRMKAAENFTHLCDMPPAFHCLMCILFRTLAVCIAAAEKILFIHFTSFGCHLEPYERICIIFLYSIAILKDNAKLRLGGPIAIFS